MSSLDSSDPASDNIQRIQAMLRRELETWDDLQLLISHDRLSLLNDHHARLDITQDELALIFRSLLHHRMELTNWLAKVSSELAMKPLVEALVDETVYRDTRIKAAEALGTVGSDTAINSLVGVLKYLDNRVRLAAIDALGRTRDERAVSPLLDLLGDRSSRIRSHTIKALAGFHVSSVVDALIHAVRLDSAPIVRAVAAKVLASWPGKRINECLSEVASTDMKQDVRKTAAVALLSRNVHPESLPVSMMEFLKDPDVNLRLQILRTFSDRIDEEVLQNVMYTAATDTRREVRETAKHTLGKIAGRDDAALLLIKLVGGEELSKLDARVLAQTLGEDKLIGLLDREISRTDLEAPEKIYSRVTQVIAYLGSARATDYLISLLSHRKWQLRRSAVEALRYVDDTRIISYLLPIGLKEKSSSIQRATIEVLKEKVEESEVADLLFAFVKSTQFEEKERIIAKLANIGDRDAIELLLLITDDDEYLVRESSVRALGDTRCEEAIQTLAKVARDDPNVFVRESAVEALVEIGTDAAFKALVAISGGKETSYYMTSYIKERLRAFRSD